MVNEITKLRFKYHTVRVTDELDETVDLPQLDNHTIHDVQFVHTSYSGSGHKGYLKIIYREKP